MFLTRLTLAAWMASLLASPLPAQDAGGSRTEAFQKLRQARAAALGGDAAKASQLVTEARSWGQSKQDRLVVAWAEQLTGEFAFAARRHDQAVAAFTAALDAFTAANDSAGMATSRVNLGRLAHAAGKPADALPHHQAALALYEKLNRSAETAATLGDVGSSLIALGRHAEAKASLQKALALYRGTVKQPAGELRVLSELAACSEAAGENDQAVQHLTAALKLAEDLKDPAESARLHHLLGQLHHKQGAHDTAAKQYQAALQLLATVKDAAPTIAAIRNNLGALLQDQAKPQEALTELTAALDQFTRLNDPAGQARALYNLALVHEGLGQDAQAIDAYERALALRRQTKDTPGTVRILDNLALLYAAQGKPDHAKTARAEADKLR